MADADAGFDSGARSPLLEASPPDRRQDLRDRRQLRLILLGGCIAGLLLIGVPLIRRLLQSEVTVRSLYRFHDQLLLPLYGYTFTLFYPISYSWWLALAGLLLASLGGFALARPPWRRLHIALLRRALRHTQPQQQLLRWCTRSWLPRLGTGMVHTVVEHDSLCARRRLEAAEPCQPGAEPRQLVAAAEQVVRLSVLQCKLSPRSREQRPRRVADLAEVLPPLLLLTGGSLHSRLHTHLLHLAAELEQVLEERPEPSPSGCFSLPVLEHDLLAVLGHLRGSQTAETGVGTGVGPVLAGIRRRRSLIDHLRRQLEQRLQLGAGAAAAQYTDPDQVPDEAAAGRLALVITMAVAILYQVPELACAYLDGLDALRFALLASGYSGNPSAGDPAALAERLCRALPRPSDYRICARLLDQRLAGADDVLAAVDEPGGIIGREDLQLILDRVARLHAAGTDPGGAVAGPQAAP